MMDMKQEISETSFLKQVNLFLQSLYPLVKVESPENLKIISTFCSDPALYQIYCNASQLHVLEEP